VSLPSAGLVHSARRMAGGQKLKSDDTDRSRGTRRIVGARSRSVSDDELEELGTRRIVGARSRAVSDDELEELNIEMGLR